MAKYYGDLPCVKLDKIHITVSGNHCACGQSWRYHRPGRDGKCHNIIWRSIDAVTCTVCKESFLSALQNAAREKEVQRTNHHITRGKRIDTGEETEGAYCVRPAATPDDSPKHYIIAAELIYAWDQKPGFAMYMYEVDPNTIAEYVRLVDSEGTPAFTGHITEDLQGRRWVIFACQGGYATCRVGEWRKYNKAVSPAQIMSWTALSDPQNIVWFETSHKIIGNIIDNPELLEDK